MGQIIFLITVCLYAVYSFIETLGYRVNAFDNTGGPALFPRIVAVLLIFFCVVLIIQTIKDKNKQKFVFVELFQGLRGKFLALFIGYIVLMQIFGFIISSCIYVPIVSNYLVFKTDGSIGKPFLVAKNSALLMVLVVAIYYAFGKFFHVMLPTGIFGI